jgi:hypothetical protein
MKLRAEARRARPSEARSRRASGDHRVNAHDTQLGPAGPPVAKARGMNIHSYRSIRRFMSSGLAIAALLAATPASARVTARIVYPTMTLGVSFL